MNFWGVYIANLRADEARNGDEGVGRHVAIRRNGHRDQVRGAHLVTGLGFGVWGLGFRV